MNHAANLDRYNMRVQGAKPSAPGNQENPSRELLLDLSKVDRRIEYDCTDCPNASRFVVANTDHTDPNGRWNRIIQKKT